MNDMTLLRRKSKKDDEVIDSLLKNYTKARIEIDELHEKYRGHKQSEEPAPSNELVLMCLKRKSVRVWKIEYGVSVEQDAYWQHLYPLEEAAKI